MDESEGEYANEVPVTENKQILCDHMCVGNICIYSYIWKLIKLLSESRAKQSQTDKALEYTIW